MAYTFDSLQISKLLLESVFLILENEEPVKCCFCSFVGDSIVDYRRPLRYWHHSGKGNILEQKHCIATGTFISNRCQLRKPPKKAYRIPLPCRQWYWLAACSLGFLCTVESWTLPWAVTSPRETCSISFARSFPDFAQTTGQERTPRHWRIHGRAARTRGFKNMEQEIAVNPMEKGKAARRKERLTTAIQWSDWPWNTIQIINANFST